MVTTWNGPVLRVLQLNTWNVEGPWVDRLVEITAIIRHHRPDVICLQEVVSGPDGRSTAHIIAEQATGAGPHTWEVAFAGTPYPEEVEGVPEGALWGVAVLSRWPIDSMHARLLSDGYPSMWNIVHARTNGLDVFSVHLTPALHDGVWRERQVREVDEFVRRHRSDSGVLPAIVGGDLNAAPDSAEIRFLTGRQSLEGTSTYFQDAWAVAGDGSAGHTWDDANPFAARLHLHPQRVDYVMVGDHFPFNAPSTPGADPGTGTGRVVGCEIVGRAPITGTPPSDHHGVLATIAW
jgi:endonuclease/exonuclease/phosphatase family metal-dependent hydrolase